MNNNWMRDFERKQFEDNMVNESRRQNDLLAFQIANQERQRKKEEEKSYKDKIDHLRLALAQASDSHQQEQIQILLNEAQADYEDYLERKRKSERIGRIISIVLLLIMIPLLFLMFKEYFGGQSNRQRSGASTVQRVLDANEEEDALGVSSQVAVSSSSDNIASSANNSVPSSSSSELPAPYANTEHTSPHEFTVNVTVTDLNIRREPSLSAQVVRAIPQGTYTIVETTEVDGHTWGKLKSGEGWISLTANAQTIPSVDEGDWLDLTTDQVKKWVMATFMSDDDIRELYQNTKVEITIVKEVDSQVYADLDIPSDMGFDAHHWRYRINSKGELEHGSAIGFADDGGYTYEWEVVSTVYTENW